MTLIASWPEPTEAQLTRLTAVRGSEHANIAFWRNRVLVRAERVKLAGDVATADDWEAVATCCGVFAQFLDQLGASKATEFLVRGRVALDPAGDGPLIQLFQILLRRGDDTAAWVELRRARRLFRQTLDARRFGTILPWVPGERLAGRTLLICPDQGLGDMLQFARFVPLLAERCRARLIVEALPPLARLFRASLRGVAEVIDAPANGVAPPMVRFDTWCLPSDPAEVYAADPAALPSAPYLTADPELVVRWQAAIDQAARGRFRIGLCWAGSPATSAGHRAIPLAELAPLAEVPGVRFFGLHKVTGQPAGTAPAAGPASEGLHLLQLGPLFADLADTAAAMMNLDLIVTCDTAVAHLAGALGRPTWVLLSAWADARWGSGAETTFRYPTMRLFHQDTLGAWGPVVERVRHELAALVRRR